MSEEKSWWERTREWLKEKGGNVPKEMLEAISGQEVKNKVTEYSDLVTQVLLGLHRDVKGHEREIQASVAEIEKLKAQAATLRTEYETKVQVLGTKLQELEGLIASVGEMRKREIQACVVEIEKLNAQAATLRTEYEMKVQRMAHDCEQARRFAKSTRWLWVLAIGSLVIGLIALGGVLWMALSRS